MRYALTLNMPVRTRYANDVPQMVHQIICEHPAQDEDALAEELCQNAFIVVDEIYRDPRTGTHFSVGPLIINTDLIGKAKLASSGNVEAGRNQSRYGDKNESP